MKIRPLQYIPPWLEFLMRCGRVATARWMPRGSFRGGRARGEIKVQPVSAKGMAAVLGDLGILEGDILMVHSDSSAIEQMGWELSSLLDFMLDYLGREGTLAMPNHPKLREVEGKLVYDVRRSPSMVGMLTELFRRRKKTLRSHYPYSTAAASGARAEELIRGHIMSYAPHDEHSPYGKLAELGGKVLCIGCPLDRITILHVAEDVMRTQMRIPNFYVEEDIWVMGDGERKSLRVHRRADRLWWYLAKYRWTHDMFSQSLVREKDISGVTLFAADARSVVDWMKGEILAGRSIYPLATLDRWLHLKEPAILKGPRE